MCVSLPADIRAMRLSGQLGREYSDKCALLLDLTLGVWWNGDPRDDWTSFDMPPADFVQAAMVVMLKFVDRFDPALSSWRTQGRWMRKELRRDMGRASRKACPGTEALEAMMRGTWQGIYDPDSMAEEKLVARIVGRRVNGYVVDRAKAERELDAILAPAIVEADVQLDLFSMA